jgi:hypothetical protein
MMKRNPPKAESWTFYEVVKHGSALFSADEREPDRRLE